MISSVYSKDIIEIGRLLLRERLVLGTEGNISARLGETEGILITPSGVPYPDIRPEDLVLVDGEGRRLEGILSPSSEVLLHTEIYRYRSEVNGIVHTHSTFASVFAVNRQEIPPVLDEVAQLIGGSVRVAEYAPPGTRQLAEYAVSALGDRQAVLLANHGLVGVGTNLREAFLVCQVVEKAAQVYLLAKLGGNPHSLSEEEAGAMRRRYLTGYGQKARREG